MGCDIHATIESRLDNNYNWWSAAINIEIDRQYSLFGYLAGVRDYNVKPLVDVRGVPSDASYAYKKEVDFWRGDGHSHSWLLFSELKQLPETYKSELFYKFLEATASKYGDENVRLCFFFDN